MTSEIAFKLSETAEWRDRKAERFPEDPRNVASSARLRTLAAQELSAEAASKYSDARAAYEDAFDGIDEIVGIEQYLGEESRVDSALSEDLRGVGFTWTPHHIDEVALSFAEIYQAAAEAVLDGIRRAQAEQAT
jgi:hypothetical protein